MGTGKSCANWNWKSLKKTKVSSRSVTSNISQDMVAGFNQGSDEQSLFFSRSLVTLVHVFVRCAIGQGTWNYLSFPTWRNFTFPSSIMVFIEHDFFSISALIFHSRKKDASSQNVKSSFQIIGIYCINMNGL